MTGRQGKDSVRRGKDNRNIILTKLMEGSLHYSGLKRELDMSNVTLSKHLKALLDEGILKRQVEGRKIVYVVARKGQTLGKMRREFRKELESLVSTYRVCLNMKIQGKLKRVLEDIDATLTQKPRSEEGEK